MKALGYRQMAGYLAGDYDFEQAVRLLKRDTRRFAKRQLTWFRREAGVQWLSIGPADTADSVAKQVLDRVESFLSGLRPDPGVPEGRELCGQPAAM
jgi:tRNA dimethylallyltransferase